MLAAALLALWAPASVAQTADLAPLRPFRLFTRQNAPGLPQNSVSAMVQDSEGVLWLGTLDGLASYDGQTMVDTAAAPGAPALGAVYALAERAAGGIYVGGTAGLYARAGDGTWQPLGSGQPLASVIEAAPGIVWAVDQQGRVHRIAARDPVRWELVSLPEGAGPAFAVAKGSPGTVWVAALDSVFRVDGARAPLRITTLPGERITALAIDRRGSPWVGTALGQLARVDPATGAASAQRACAPGVPVTALAEDTRNRLWAGCADGRLSMGPSEGPREYWGVDEGLRLTTRIISLAVDRHGSVWVGRNGAGAMQLVSERWRHRSHWSGTDYQTGEAVFGITPLAGGGALMAVFNRGIWHWDGQRVVEIGRERGLTENTRTVAQPEPGVLWVGGRFGLFESRGSRRFARVLTLPSGFVTGLDRSPDGTWHALTSTAGLWTFRDGAWEPETAINAKLPHLAVRSAAWLRNGELWLATGSGIAVVRNGAVSALHGAGEPGSFLANCILELPDGDIWVGGMGGLWIRHDGAWRRLTARDGIPGRTVYSLAIAPDGAIWAGGATGVGRFENGGWETYARDSGLVEEECTLEGLGVLPDGRVLVGTMGSLAVFDPATPMPPEPLLSAFWRDTPPVGADRIAHLPAGERSARVRWSAPWLTGQPIEYQTRVRPEQSEFSPPTNRTELELSEMGAGRRSIEVRARIGGARPSPWSTPIELQLDVAPRFYETWWAAVLGAAALLGLFQLGVKARTLRLERREKELQQAVDTAVADVKTLRGLIPICASCKCIRDDHGSWNQMEAYLKQHSDVMLSHGICPDCMKKLYPDYTDTPGT